MIDRGVDDGARFQVSSADEDYLKSLGWDLDGHAPGPEHVCPECVYKEKEPEELEGASAP